MSSAQSSFIEKFLKSNNFVSMTCGTAKVKKETLYDICVRTRLSPFLINKNQLNQIVCELTNKDEVTMTQAYGAIGLIAMVIDKEHKD